MNSMTKVTDNCHNDWLRTFSTSIYASPKKVVLRKTRAFERIVPRKTKSVHHHKDLI